MSTAACRNKGIILDGYPRNINDAKQIFLKKIDNYSPLSMNEEASNIDEGNPFPGYDPITEFIPEYVIVL